MLLGIPYAILTTLVEAEMTATVMVCPPRPLSRTSEAGKVTTSADGIFSPNSYNPHDRPDYDLPVSYFWEVDAVILYYCWRRYSLGS